MLSGVKRVPSCIWYLAAVLTTCVLSLVSGTQPPRPHFIVILADDMGWNDVGFHGADDVSTPNIDALAYNGIILNQHYTLPLCTPSRAAFLTGKYPIRTGMQHVVILEDEPWGLGLEEKLLPQYLKEVGYSTHAIGKWHLGFFRREYTPTFRGFDSHFGYWQGYHDYYNHSVKPEHIDIDGYDMRRNMEPAWDALGKYSTDLFTDEAVKLIKEHKEEDGPMFLYVSHLAPHTGTPRDPMQAPYETVAKFKHIPDLERRMYAAMVSKLDDSVGEIVAALQDSRMLDNSVIMFLSDNGAATTGDHSNKGSNYPMRGMKAYPWEGATRGNGAIWSPLLKRTQTISNQLLHLVDWLPTLATLAGVDVKNFKDLDGKNVWSHISEGDPSPRNELLYNIDTVDYPYAAVRRDKWKYVNGTPHNVDNGWLGLSGRDSRYSYSTNKILDSKVASTITGYYIRKAIVDNIKLGNNKKLSLTQDDIETKPLNAGKILELRNKAELHCLSGSSKPWSRWEDCNPLKKPCLFDLDWDPCEEYNIAEEYPDVADEMNQLLKRFISEQVDARNKPGESSANPALWNNTFTCWHDELDHISWISRLTRTVIISTVCFACIICLIPALTAMTNRAHKAKKRIMMESVDLTENSTSSSLTGQICVREE